MPSTTAQPARAVPERPGTELIELSLVTTVFNEEETVLELHTRLTRVLEELGRPYEIIIVEGGSRDRTYERCLEVAAADPHVKLIHLSRNFGHHTSMTAGLDHARGEVIVMMDGDLQHRAEDIPRFLQKLEEGDYDVVIGIRSTKGIPPFKRFTSKIFNNLMRRMLREPVQIDSNIYRIMRRKVVRSFLRCRERSRFVTGLLGWVGFKRGELEIELDPRHAGTSKYSLSRMLRLATDSITGFSYFPLELASYTGFTLAVLSIVYGLYLVARKTLLNTAVEGWTSLACAIFFVGGVQMMMMGVFGSYLGRVYTEVQDRPLYIIDDTRNMEWSAED